MKFHESAACLAPALPGGLARAERMRELISMFTTVTDTEWGTKRDPSTLAPNSVLESLASRDTGVTKKLANAICARLNINAFVERLHELDLATQELITQSVATYGERVELEHFDYDVAALLIGILHEKAKLSDTTAAELRRAKIHAALVKYRYVLLVSSRGCATCRTLLVARSHDFSQDYYDIVFLTDATDQPGPDDFAVMCKRCAERYNLAHTDADLMKLRATNQALTAAETIDEQHAPLGLDSKIAQLLTVIYQLPFDQVVRDTNYDVVELKSELDDRALLRQCFGAMATYAPVVRAAAKSLEAKGQLDFELMRHQIKSAWLVMRDVGLSQYGIWQRLTAWIHEYTEVDRYVCGVVVVFMIQICDLFTPKPMAVSA